LPGCQSPQRMISPKKLVYTYCVSCCAVTLSVGQQEGRLPFKKPGIGMLAGGNDLTAFHVIKLQLSPPLPLSLLQQNPEWCRSGTGLPGFSWKMAIKRALCCCAGDFETNGSRCEPHELLYTLRAFGQLNYIPPNAGNFFSAVERILMSRFTEFDAASVLEMLVSFVYIERFPVNFLGHISSPHFLTQIKGWYLLALSLQSSHLSY